MKKQRLFILAAILVTMLASTRLVFAEEPFLYAAKDFVLVYEEPDITAGVV